MESLALKLILTPLLIGFASLAGRRWGPAISGWLVGLPFTSGPIVFIVALSRSAAFAAAVAAGTLAGTISQAVFCLAYAWVAVRSRWPISILTGVIGFALSTVLLRYLTLPPVAVFCLVVALLLVALALMPHRPRANTSKNPVPPWDIPARMIVATAFVLLLTGAAGGLGPRVTGLLAPFPLYAAVLAVFSHRGSSAAAASAVLHGLLLGLFAFATFFVLLAILVHRSGIAPAFAVAIGAALTLQACSLWIVKRGALSPSASPRKERVH